MLCAKEAGQAHERVWRGCHWLDAERLRRGGQSAAYSQAYNGAGLVGSRPEA